MRKILLLLSLALTVPFTAFADEAPPLLANLGSMGRVYQMCNEASGWTPADCSADGAGTNPYVLDTGGFDSITIDFSQSGATTLDCDLVGNNVGHDTASGTGQILNSVAFSASQFTITFDHTPRYVWVNCTTASGGTDTVVATALARQVK